MNRKSPARNALNLILYFLMIVATLTIICAFIFTVYKLCARLVSGQKTAAFHPILFVKGVLLFAPIVLTASGVFMLLHLMRHTSSSWIPLTVYILLYGAAWFILIPVDFTLEKKFSSDQNIFSEKQEQIILSPGYFRDVYDENSARSIWYYSKVSKRNKADGVCINVSTAPDSTSGRDSTYVFTFSNAQLNSPDDGFSDSLIEKTVQMNPFVEYSVKYLRTFSLVARKEFFAGTIPWYAYLSIALALISVAGLRHLSQWRLVNLISVSCATILIVLFNNLAYTSSVLNPAADFMNELLSPVRVQGTNPFAVLVNLLIFITFAITGIICDIKHKAHMAEEEILEGY